MNEIIFTLYITYKCVYLKNKMQVSLALLTVPIFTIT